MAVSKGVSFDVRSGVKEMALGIGKDAEKHIPTALNQTINRTLRKARTEADKGIRQELNIKKADVTKNMKIHKSTKRTLWGKVTAFGKGLGLIKFGAKQTKKGVTFKVKKKHGRKLLKSGFIRKMKSGHVGVFVRKDKVQRRGAKHGLPIKEGITTSVPEAFSNKIVRDALVKLGQSFFWPEFTRNLKRHLDKKPKVTKSKKVKI